MSNNLTDASRTAKRRLVPSGRAPASPDAPRVDDLCSCTRYPEFGGTEHNLVEHGMVALGLICSCRDYADVHAGPYHGVERHDAFDRERKRRRRELDGETRRARVQAEALRDVIAPLLLPARAAIAPTATSTSAPAVAAPSAESPTLSALGKRWTSGALHREFPDYVKEKKTVQDDVERLRYIYEAPLAVGPYRVVGDVPLARFDESHGNAVMAALPAHLSRGTRRHVARLLNRLLNLAADHPIRLIERNPLPHGFVPPPAKKKARAWYTPAEDGLVCGCTKTPLVSRLFYGFVLREGLRETEGGDLQWRDLDFRYGTGRLTLDENKTDDRRAWALWAGTREALGAWRALLRAAGVPAEDDDYVFVHHAPFKAAARGTRLYVEQLAKTFRGHVRVAGAMRPEFETTTDTRLRLVFHDLRGGFVSWALATGRNESWVMDRTGHKSSEVLYRYKRRARGQRELEVGEPPRLIDVLPELAQSPVPSPGGAAASTLGSAAAEKGGCVLSDKCAEVLSNGTSRAAHHAEVAEWQTQRTQNPPSERA
jgi:integrase